MKPTNDRKPSLIKSGEMAFPKYLIAGALTTALVYLLYLGLLFFIPYIWAYSISYVFGIAFGYCLNSTWVFKKDPKLQTATVYVLSYFFNYFLGVSILWLVVDVIKLPKEVAPAIVMVISVPIMFVLTKTLFHGRKKHESHNLNQ